MNSHPHRFLPLRVDGIDTDTVDHVMFAAISRKAHTIGSPNKLAGCVELHGLFVMEQSPKC